MVYLTAPRVPLFPFFYSRFGQVFFNRSHWEAAFSLRAASQGGPPLEKMLTDGAWPDFCARVQPSLRDGRSIFGRIPGVGNAGLFSCVPPGLGFPSSPVTPDLRPGLLYAAAPRLGLIRAFFRLDFHRRTMFIRP
jgi:hypothetical protein